MYDNSALRCHWDNKNRSEQIQISERRDWHDPGYRDG